MLYKFVELMKAVDKMREEKGEPPLTPEEKNHILKLAEQALPLEEQAQEPLNRLLDRKSKGLGSDDPA